MASAISRALRFSVPLNNKCSIRCDMPLFSTSSLREPDRTQNPRVTERTCGISSVTIRIPLSNTVRLYNPVPPNLPVHWHKPLRAKLRHKKFLASMDFVFPFEVTIFPQMGKCVTSKTSEGGHFVFRHLYGRRFVTRWVHELAFGQLT